MSRKKSKHVGTSNLIPLSERTKAEQRAITRKGGSQRTLAKKLSGRKNCNSGCVLWGKCWAQPLAIGEYNTKLKEAQKKYGTKGKKIAAWKSKNRARCKLKEMPTRTYNRTVRLMEGTERGFEDTIIETLLHLGLDVDAEPSAHKKAMFLEELRKAKDSIFGKKTRVQASRGEAFEEDIMQPEQKRAIISQLLEADDEDRIIDIPRGDTHEDTQDEEKD